MVYSRELAAIYWTMKIDGYAKFSDINRNSKRARKVARLLEEMGLAQIESIGRVKLVRLTAKGYKVRRRMLELLLDISEVQTTVNISTTSDDYLETQPQQNFMPNWLYGNPWLQVIGERGKA